MSSFSSGSSPTTDGMLLLPATRGQWTLLPCFNVVIALERYQNNTTLTEEGNGTDYQHVRSAQDGGQDCNHVLHCET